MQNGTDGSYLLRPSTSRPGDLAVSVRYVSQSHHRPLIVPSLLWTCCFATPPTAMVKVMRGWARPRKIFKCIITPKPRRRGGVRCGEGVSPSPLGEGSGDVPSPENFLFLKLKMESFGAFWALLFTFQLRVCFTRRKLVLTLGLGKLAAIICSALPAWVNTTSALSPCGSVRVRTPPRSRQGRCNVYRHPCTAGTQKTKRQKKMPVGNSEHKIILYVIGSKML